MVFYGIRFGSMVFDLVLWYNDAIVPSTDVVVPQTLNNSATVFQDSAVKTSLEALTEEHDRLQDDINRQQRDMDTVTDEMKAKFPMRCVLSLITRGKSRNTLSVRTETGLVVPSGFLNL